MTKNQTIDLLRNQLPGFYSAEQVINMIEKIEDKTSKISEEAITGIVDSIMLALKDENDRGNIVNSEDVELELSWNKTIEVTDIPINFGTIEECIQEELIRFMNYEENDVVEPDNE